MTLEEDMALIREENARIKAENDALKRGEGALRLKVGEKGGASLYGLQRYPITLYKEQWEKLLDFAPEIRQFLKDNADKLKSKEEKKT